MGRCLLLLLHHPRNLRDARCGALASLVVSAGCRAHVALIPHERLLGCREEQEGYFKRAPVVRLSSAVHHKPWNVADSRVRSVRAAMEMEKLVIAEDRPATTKTTGLQTLLNKASKWLVSSATGGLILWRHDEHRLWMFIGAVACGGICKGLKYLINHKRPPTADGRKMDPGMPSSHAQGFMFLSTYAGLSLLLEEGVRVWTVVSSFLMVVFCAYLSWLRIAEGLHTVPQVLVGGALGTTIASCWLWLWTMGIESFIENSPSAKIFLLVVSLFAGILLCNFVIKFWFPKRA